MAQNNMGETSAEKSIIKDDVPNGIVGLGIDIADVSRIKKLLEKYGDAFIDKTFSASEKKYCAARADAPQHYAARFAAKEAVAKALGTGFANGISLLGISVENDELGAPHINLDKACSERLNRIGASKVLISLTHLKDYAQAIAIAIR